MEFLNKQSTFTKVGFGAVLFGLIFFAYGEAIAAEPAAWTSVTASGKLSNGMTLTIEEELRYTGVDLASQTTRHTDTSVSTSGKGFSFTLGHRNTDNGADRTYVGISKSLGDVAGWDATASTTVELFDDDTVRNRTMVSAQKATTVAGVTPWLSTEFFVTDKGTLTSNRTTFGVAKSVNDSTAVDVWYQTDTDMSGSNAATTAVGVGLNISL